MSKNINPATLINAKRAEIALMSDAEYSQFLDRMVAGYRDALLKCLETNKRFITARDYANRKANIEALCDSEIRETQQGFYQRQELIAA